MKYYAMINDKQVGPMELPELVKAGLMPDTYVWCKGMTDWQQANEVADICRFFRNRIFDLMHPTVETPQSGADAKEIPAEPLADEDYKGMKRREFYNTVSQQIQQTAVDPEQDRLSQGEPPSTLPGFLVILAVILFFPLGIPAAYLNHKAQAQWRAGLAEDSYRSAHSAKMCGGIALCIGVIAFATLIQWLLR